MEVSKYEDHTLYAHWIQLEDNEITFIDEVAHYFNDVPVSVYINNDELYGDFERVKGLIDAYDKTQSDTANDFQLNIPDLSMLTKMQGLFSPLGGSDDDRTHLLLALKPFLSNQRKHHIDRAIQLLKLSKLAEAAKGMDILKDLKL